MGPSLYLFCPCLRDYYDVVLHEEEEEEAIRLREARKAMARKKAALAGALVLLTTIRVL